MEDILRITQFIIEKLPLGVFVFFGSFLEEVIAPIPAPFIMTTAGLTAMQRDYSWLGLAGLVTFGAIGKTLASWLLYVIADKTEDIFIGKIGKFFGVTHEQVEKFGKLFSKGWYDDFFLFFLRAFPLFPTFIVSVGCGVIKLNMRTFLVSTFLGTIIRNIFYLSLGYYGSKAFEIWQTLLQTNLVFIYFGFVIIGITLSIMYWYRNTLKQKYFPEKNL